MDRRVVFHSRWGRISVYTLALLLAGVVLFYAANGLRPPSTSTTPQRPETAAQRVRAIIESANSNGLCKVEYNTVANDRTSVTIFCSTSNGYYVVIVQQHWQTGKLTAGVVPIDIQPLPTPTPYGYRTPWP